MGNNPYGPDTYRAAPRPAALHQADFSVGFSIEGVDDATATRITKLVRQRLADTFDELVRDAAEAGPDRTIHTYSAQTRFAPGRDDDEEQLRRVEQHEAWLATEGADHLFEGRGE